MTHPVITEGNTAVVTGGAAGIGLAAASYFASHGMKVCIVDLGADRLAKAAEQIGGDVLTVECDVSDRSAVAALEARVSKELGGADILMNNAGIQPGSDITDSKGTWERVLAVNLGGVVNGSQVFLSGMLARNKPGMIINTGSKQGITTPPGDPAYNVSKSGVKTFTEALAHELRNIEGCQLTAHLLIPGFVFTDINRNGRTERPAGAWTPEQCVEFMAKSLDAGDFYILCPDNDVSRELDEKRMAWAMGDIIENRPPLSRWHPDYDEAFAKYIG